MSDVESLQSREVTRSPVDGSKIGLPDYNKHLATRRILQVEGQFKSPTRHSRRGIFRILGSVALLPVLGAAYKILSGEKASAQVEDKGVGQDYTRTYIDNLGNQITWRGLTGTDGIPPNNPDHSIDTIFVSVNSSDSVPAQPNDSLFPADTNSIAIYGHRADFAVNRGYAPISIERNSTGGGKDFPYILVFLDAKNITDRNKQLVITDLPKGGTYADSFSYFDIGSDSKGKYLKFGIQNSINPKDDGNYIIRLDNSGLPVGGTVKIESAVMSRRGFIPFIGNAYTGK